MGLVIFCLGRLRTLSLVVSLIAFNTQISFAQFNNSSLFSEFEKSAIEKGVREYSSHKNLANYLHGIKGQVK